MPYTKIKFSTPGPWDNEPDNLKFEHIGLKCEIMRVPKLGHLCGYVELPKNHIWNEFTDENFGFINVHGGITYCFQQGGSTIIGFDCAHVGDLIPSRNYTTFGTQDSYKDIDYVMNECKSLVQIILSVGVSILTDKKQTKKKKKVKQTNIPRFIDLD